jgi:hypothetical protein
MGSVFIKHVQARAYMRGHFVAGFATKDILTD